MCRDDGTTITSPVVGNVGKSRVFAIVKSLPVSNYGPEIAERFAADGCTGFDGTVLFFCLFVLKRSPRRDDEIRVKGIILFCFVLVMRTGRGPKYRKRKRMSKLQYEPKETDGSPHRRYASILDVGRFRE